MLQGKIHRTINERNGFALLDVLLGIAIISVALVGIAFSWRQSTVTTINVRNYNQATYYAQQALEQLKVYDGQTSLETPSQLTVPAAGNLPAFKVKTEKVKNTDMPADFTALNSFTDKLVVVKATVEWNEPSGAEPFKLEVLGYYFLK